MPIPPARREGLRLDPGTLTKGARIVIAMAALGALWGFVAYAILWGYTPLAVDRRFVVSGVGLLLLLPVRVVLASIHLVEAHLVRHPFDFSRNHQWIGLTAAVVGAGLAGGTALLGVIVRRAFSRE